jgi:hypothetical protein
MLGLITILVIIAAAFFGVGLWWWFPRWQMRSVRGVSDRKARADIEDNFRKTVGQALGGIAVLIAAGVAYYGTLQTSHVNEDQRVSNQVAKGFEQLGSKKLVVRLGGIYALEAVMNTSEQYHQPVLEALCAFVRDSTKTATVDAPPATDVQAALTVVGRREVIGMEPPDWTKMPLDKRPDLDKAQVPNAELGGRVNLAGFNLGGINLTGAFLNDANLTGAWLPNAELAGAVLRKANLTHAWLMDAWLMNVDLTVDKKDMALADLTDAVLTSADLRGAIITQQQLNEACGTNVAPDGLTIKPC